jgi:ribosome-associated heat shock protein Hsp15
MRLDQWLWAVRVYKTRTLATGAIRSGHVRIQDLPAKPAREVHPGDIVVVQLERLRRTLRVVGSPPSRVGAKDLPAFVEDLTPSEEQERARLRSQLMVPCRPKGQGRPTKRDRRLWQRIDSGLRDDVVP